jgi:DNA-binding beta-propeller fold protein YncE
MSLKPLGSIDLPSHVGQGGFDHAAVDRGRGLLYVAHTVNDAVDVVDTRSGTYLRSISGLRGVAGALVDEGQGLVFVSNRGEDSVGIFASESPDTVTKIAVGVRPNGLAYDPTRGLLLSANVGDPTLPGSCGASIVDVRARRLLATVTLPGRTRWTVFDPEQQAFFVNIADPARIVAVTPDATGAITRQFEVPERGPHGLDLDRSRSRLYCACDSG